MFVEKFYKSITAKYPVRVNMCGYQIVLYERRQIASNEYFIVGGILIDSGFSENLSDFISYFTHN